MRHIIVVLFILGHLSVYSQPLHDHLFQLSEVELLDGPFKASMDVNIETLLKYDVDRLLEPFLTEAGITPKGDRYTNWDGLSGHVGGHYLSAMAIHYAASGNQQCKSRMEYMISELKACQDKNENGYLGGVPNSDIVWTGVKDGTFNEFSSAWVPWYNLHKTYAGLRDAYLYGGNEVAKEMFLDLCDWGIATIANLSEAQMQNMLATEFGGMNEVYADAYKMTGQTKYLETAEKFTHYEMYDAFVSNYDNLDNKHANTQIPKFVGFASVGEYANDQGYLTAASNFWDKVVNDRSLALGGNSRREFFPAASATIEYMEDREGPESCNTYNMLKLSSQLHGLDPDAKYADYYERALFNHILSTQHPSHGGYVYFTPVRPMHYRVYSAPNQAMWCCVGTGMENHGKHGEFIYSYDDDQLYVNLFIASKLSWKEKGVTITQTTDFPYEETSKITIGGSGTIDFKIRYPSWVKEGEMQIKINGGTYPITAMPGEYISLKSTWSDGDEIELKMPMHLSFEKLPNLSEYKAFMYGPILLGARTGSEDLDGLVADDGRWSHIAYGRIVASYNAPLIVSNDEELLEKISPVEGEKLTFGTKDLFVGQEEFKDLVLEPFYMIHDSRYMMYWLNLKPEEAEQYLEEQREDELARLILDARTIDHVSTGEQQPEADHNFTSYNSSSGVHENEFWRDATDEGFFSYEMATGGRTDLSLMVRYWGNESGFRNFEILVDDALIAKESLSNKWNVSEFVEVEYPIDSMLVKNKDFVRVRFQALNGNIAGGVFYVRMLKKN
jgi:DUF1680 family protein